MQLTIKWQNQSQSGEETISDQATTSIGRARENQIRLKDRHVSRRHATISAKSGKWYLRNISNNNIVRKGGHRVDPGQEVVLREGDIFEVGPIQFHALLINRKGKKGRKIAKLQCERCDHIVEHKPHDFCPWCGLSLSTAVLVHVSE